MVNHIFEEVDRDGNGEIDYEELDMLAPYFSSVAWTPEVKRAMFTEMDKDAGGSVCADEFYEWMIESAQLEVSAEGVTKMKQYAARRSYLRALRAQASRAPCAQANEPRLRPRQTGAVSAKTTPTRAPRASRAS